MIRKRELPQMIRNLGIIKQEVCHVADNEKYKDKLSHSIFSRFTCYFFCQSDSDSSMNTKKISPLSY